jgi:hypothetical protein
MMLSKEIDSLLTQVQEQGFAQRTNDRHTKSTIDYVKALHKDIEDMQRKAAGLNQIKSDAMKDAAYEFRLQRNEDSVLGLHKNMKDYEKVLQNFYKALRNPDKIEELQDLKTIQKNKK